MHKPLSRRTVLRGAGVALGLPLLEVMSPSIARAASTASSARLTEPPRRLAYLFMPNGVRPDYWTPEGDGEQYGLTPHLEPLKGLEGDFLLIENLWNQHTVGRNGHWPKVPAWLHGGYVERSTGSDLNSGGTSADQLIAQRTGHLTPLPSLELGIDAPRTGIDNIGGGFARAYGSYISWRDPHTPVAKEIVPQLAFDRLFRTGGADRDDVSVLDAVLDDARQLKGKASAPDKAKIDEYFESIRGVEQRMKAALEPQARWVNAKPYALGRPAATPPASHEEHVRLMLEILILAFWTDSTRVGTFMFGDAQSQQDYSFLPGVSGGFHSISHHLNEPVKLGQYVKIVNWHTTQLAWFLTRLRSLDENGTSLLDNSMILFGSSLKDGNRHLEENLPLLLAGRGKGALKPGRRLRAPKRTPMCNLHLALIERMGVELKQFGDSTGALAGLS